MTKDDIPYSILCFLCFLDPPNLENFSELELIMDALYLANLLGNSLTHEECQTFEGKASVNLVFM